MKCPTCRRRPSERVAQIPPLGSRLVVTNCLDPIHGLADHAPALLEALEEALSWLEPGCYPNDYDPEWKKLEAYNLKAERVLASAKSGGPRLEASVVPKLLEALERVESSGCADEAFERGTGRCGHCDACVARAALLAAKGGES